MIWQKNVKYIVTIGKLFETGQVGTLIFLNSNNFDYKLITGERREILANTTKKPKYLRVYHTIYLFRNLRRL